MSRPPRGDGALLSSPEAELTAERLEAVLPAELIEDDEVVLLMLRPSLLFVPLASLGALTVIAVVALVLALMAIRWPSAIPWQEAHAYGLGVAAAAVRLLWQCLEWWCRIYVLTDRRVIRRMGVLRRSEEVV